MDISANKYVKHQIDLQSALFNIDTMLLGEYYKQQLQILFY